MDHVGVAAPGREQIIDNLINDGSAKKEEISSQIQEIFPSKAEQSTYIFYQNLPMKPRAEEDSDGSSDEDCPLDEDPQTDEMESTLLCNEEETAVPDEEKINKLIQSTREFLVFSRAIRKNCWIYLMI